MTNIIVNSHVRTITLTSKKFADAASRYGTAAYDELQAVRRDYPDFRVVVKKGRVSKPDTNKGLSYAFMERYIKAHDDENGSVLAAFDTLRATSDEAKTLAAEAASYSTIKAWFFQQFPEFAEFQKKREEILKAVADKATA